MDREAWHAAVHGVAKSRTRLSDGTELNWEDIYSLISIFLIEAFCCFVQSLNHVQIFTTPWTAVYRLICPSLSPGVCSNSCHWVGDASNHLMLCHPFPLLPSIFPSIRIFSSESVLHIRWPNYWSFSFNISPSMNIQDWFPLGLTGLISLQSKGLSRDFSNTTVQKHQFFSAQFSLWSNSHTHTWLLEKP